MSYIKRYLEDHICEFSDEELLAMGYSREDVKLMRELFTTHKKDEGA